MLCWSPGKKHLSIIYYAGHFDIEHSFINRTVIYLTTLKFGFTLLAGNYGWAILPFGKYINCSPFTTSTVLNATMTMHENTKCLTENGALWIILTFLCKASGLFIHPVAFEGVSEKKNTKWVLHLLLWNKHCSSCIKNTIILAVKLLITWT